MHGAVSRFEEKQFAKLRSGDILIICGDFGFIWNGDGQEEKILQFMGRQKYKILFVDGCHENFDKLYSYPEDQWCGGRIHRINDNVFHLCRGQVFDIEGQTIFTMGGGFSPDADIRTSRAAFSRANVADGSSNETFQLPTDFTSAAILESASDRTITQQNPLKDPILTFCIASIP